jgi:hypothetical protein
MEHGFGQLAGEFLHARAFPGGEDDSFHFNKDEHRWPRMEISK